MIDAESLRKKVIDLAIQGKLTQQLPEDGSAENLYAQIQEEKAKLIKEGKIKKEKPFPPISEDEIPFELPRNWKWIRFKDLGQFKGGKTPSMSNKEYWTDGTVPWVTSKDMKQKYIETSQLLISENAARELSLFPPQTILFVVRSGILRRLFPVAILLKSAAINQDLKALCMFLPDLHEYVYYMLKGLESRILSQYAKDGTTVNNLMVDALLTMPVPLPPLAEQKRIVEKIEEIFVQIDLIDTLQQKYGSDREILKGKIIDAGIRGLLTEQLPKDGTAKELREEAIKYKEELAKEGILKNRKNKDIREISDEECFFDIPSSWSWFRLGEVIEVFGRIGFRGYKKADLVQRGQGAITMSPSNIAKSGEVNFDSSTYISWEKYEESPEIMLEEGDIVLVKTGSTYGKCGIIDKLPEQATINPQLAILKYIKCNRKYLYYVLRSTVAWAQFESFVVGAATPTFSQEKISNMMIPMPPMAEQERIVNMLDQIFADK